MPQYKNLVIGDSNSTFIKLSGFENLAEPGSRVKDVLAKLNFLDGGEVLIIGVGVNDAAIILDTKYGNFLKPNFREFRKDYSDLLSLAKRKFKRVIVLGLVSSTEEKVILENSEIQYLNKTILKFNEVIKRLCADLEIQFVDILPCFLGKEKELLEDHIHPNQKGKEIVLDYIFSLKVCR
jgi:lysophospholipase L1-like esterase